MEGLEGGDEIERAFPKDELIEVYERLEDGDETALPLWCVYFTVLAAYSAGKCAAKAYGIWHEDLYDERKSAACIVAANIGREVLEGTTVIDDDPESYVWASMRHKMIDCDKKDRAKGATRSKSGWQGKRFKFNEIEIPVPGSATRRLEEEIRVCCKNDFERDVYRLFAENGNDLDKVAGLLGRASEEVQRCRGIIADRLAKRMREQGEPDRQLEKSAKTLKAVRPRRKQSDNWQKDSPMSSGKKRSRQRV